jgi:hypothetical protein
MDRIGVFALIGGQARENRFHLLRGKEGSATSPTEFRKALVELGITMNHSGHTLSLLPTITLHRPKHCHSQFSGPLETEHAASLAW